jgi:plastocyanin
MNKATKTVLVIVVLAVVVGAGLVFFLPNKSNAPGSSTNSSDTNSSDASPTDEQTVAATITFDGNTFSSSADTVNSGDRVKITNNSDQELQFDSDPHPVHTDNSELNVDEVAPGESKTFVLNKKGTWGYHNHLNSGQSGKITVK